MFQWVGLLVRICGISEICVTFCCMERNFGKFWEMFEVTQISQISQMLGVIEGHTDFTDLTDAGTSAKATSGGRKRCSRQSRGR